MTNAPLSICQWYWIGQGMQPKCHQCWMCCIALGKRLQLAQSEGDVICQMKSACNDERYSPAFPSLMLNYSFITQWLLYIPPSSTFGVSSVLPWSYLCASYDYQSNQCSTRSSAISVPFSVFYSSLAKPQASKSQGLWQLHTWPQKDFSFNSSRHTSWHGSK